MRQNEREEVQFNYFEQVFREELEEGIVFWMISKYGIEKGTQNYNEMIEAGYDCEELLLPEERLQLYDQALLRTCQLYCDLEKIHLESPEKSALAFVKQILDTMKGEEYINNRGLALKMFLNQMTTFSDSFLKSLELIFCHYFSVLEKGHLALTTSFEKNKTECEITINSLNQMTECKFYHMNRVEEAQTLLRVLTLERNGGIGPIPNVVYKYDKNDK